MPRLKSQIDPVTPAGRSVRLRTAEQNKAYWRLIGRLGVDEDTRRAILMERYRKPSSRWLTRAEMADLLNWLAHRAGETPEYEPAITPGGASVAQVRLIETLETELGWDNPNRLAGLLRKLAGCEVPTDLTSRQASRVIEILKSIKDRTVHHGDTEDTETDGEELR